MPKVSKTEAPSTVSTCSLSTFIRIKEYRVFAVVRESLINAKGRGRVLNRARIRGNICGAHIWMCP